MTPATARAAGAATLLDVPPALWPGHCAPLGLAPWMARSAVRRILGSGVASWMALTDLPLRLRRRLDEEAPILRGRQERALRAADGTVKILVRYPDGAAVEAVGMPGAGGPTFCLSTQVGCPVQCPFCASGIGGLKRNLSAGEILEQVLWLRSELGAFQRLVVMGMGEPGFNLDSTLAALEALLDERGGGLGARRVTVSTVAPRGALPRLAAWGRPVNVALSLHACDDELRRALVPGVGRRTLAETLREAEELFQRTGREVTVEYVLLRGVNDAPAQARALARLLAGRRFHVNLIPYNEVADLPFQRPAPAAQREFAAVLRRGGVGATVRRSYGSAVAAACGQLRRLAV